MTGDCGDTDFSPLAVIAIHGFMASVRGAPLPAELPGATATLVADLQEILPMSLSLIDKVLGSINDTHKSCIHTEVSGALF